MTEKEINKLKDLKTQALNNYTVLSSKASMEYASYEECAKYGYLLAADSYMSSFAMYTRFANQWMAFVKELNGVIDSHTRKDLEND